jgi:pimeloyl-ACP methyl ester carboxylesterase
MKKPFLLLALMTGVVFNFASIAETRGDAIPASPALEGNWQGTLDAMGTKLRIVFRVSGNPDGSLKAVLDSPDQGAKDIPVSETETRGDSIIFRVAAVMGVYEGLVQQDGKSVQGTWKQGGMSFPLALCKTDQVPTVNRPQEPKPPFPYRQEEVVFRNAKAGIELAGTLTLPEKGGPFAAVVMITGSGPEDRDETVFGHRPFLILSDYLTRRGFAVLRYDDRGVGKSKGDFGSATTEDFASDALAAVEFLKERKDIDPKKIGLAGHSEGAIVAPMVADESKNVAFVVLLASPGMTGEQLLILQGAAINKANGVDEKTNIKSEAIQKRLFSELMQEKDNAKAETKLREILKEAVEGMSAEEKARIGYNEEAINLQIKQLLSPWFRFFLAYDPSVNLSKLKCPVLALWGEKDTQVPPMENLPLVQAALKKAGNGKAVLKVLPGVNHLFQTAGTGSPSEYSKIEETFSPAALSVIGDWIARITGER